VGLGWGVGFPFCCGGGGFVGLGGVFVCLFVFFFFFFLVVFPQYFGLVVYGMLFSPNDCLPGRSPESFS